MIQHQKPLPQKRGATLVEAVISIGVLAVAIPLVFGALAEAGRSGGESGSANRSTVIVAECLTAIDRIRNGSPSWFQATPPSTPFPPAGETWALAFREDGRVIGRISENEYTDGLRTKDGETIRYLARLSAQSRPNSVVTQATEEETYPLLQLTIDLEYPAFQKAENRKSRSFHSLIR